MTIYKGKIITCDKSNTVANFLVEDDGKIVYVGHDLPQGYSNAKILNLGKRALLPSFVDTHIHFASHAIFSVGPDISSAGSNLEIVNILKDYVKRTRHKIILAYGASPHSVVEGRLISRKDLDEVSATRPIMMVRYDGHACIVNQAMIGMLDDGIKSQRGFNAETGEMRQEAFFAVSDFATKSVPVLEMVKNMQRTVDALAAKGIGMIHTVSGVGFPRDMDVDLECIVGKGVQGGFQARVFFQTMDIAKVLKRRLPRIGGCFATALDGSFGSLDAAMIEPYQGTQDKGILFYNDETVFEFCKKANRLGLQIEMHAVGDAAFNQAARALKAALDDYPRKDHRHGILHAFVPTEEGIRICAQYGIQLAVQPGFFRLAQEPYTYLHEILGSRADHLQPLREFTDRGIVLTLGSDAPCTPPDPIKWIHNACNNPASGQSVTVYEALRMATYNGCWATFDEDSRGSLEAGKIADMVILSECPYDVPVSNLDRISVEQLILSGKPYHKQTHSIATLILRGFMSKQKI